MLCLEVDRQVVLTGRTLLACRVDGLLGGRQDSEAELEQPNQHEADLLGTTGTTSAAAMAAAADIDTDRAGDALIPAHPADISGFTVRKYASNAEAVGVAMRTTHVVGHDNAASAWVRVYWPVVFFWVFFWGGLVLTFWRHCV